ncbi:single-stranded DNA-binding protein [Weissella muntiaci]|uniref:Single-stranded DNA-binding protein n=1 Tax=Weissella muntiaci TaxID=2508881 RepID=A0A6C2C901_9LACO|nr:single-stranded DNA-binding protein [Weissella muntiaci]TYC49635.1 single-stranded DNA-binding protein [Weissella muntiaci]
MLNRVVLTGRLTKDVEVRYTQSGIATASAHIAVARNYKNSSGETESDFINLVLWRKPAENFANFFDKGSLVGVEGRFQSRSYDDQQGNKRYVTEVVVDNFTFLESRADREARQGQQFDQNNNFNQQSNNAPMFGGTEVDINSDDLPF